ncbi:MAG: ergothioneine biosynthesis protein EgtB [Thermaerobacter sp.]|nr:ergothioneine biosynthesis protein EgtB [Thermaerobacter sp.]
MTTTFPQTLAAVTVNQVAAAYRRIRAVTVALAEPLEIEDYVIQSCPEASPPKWHLAHTTWFFETLVLAPRMAGYSAWHPLYRMLFNSYYETVGPFFRRAHRGTLSRPTVKEVLAYRARVDGILLDWITTVPEAEWDTVVSLIGWGLQHEQQHQELLMMDILANFAANPLAPAYQAPSPERVSPPAPMEWLAINEGPALLGHHGPGFAYDNEGPRHTVWLNPARIANRTVTNGEFQDFLSDGGYQTPTLWLSDGWQWVNSQHWGHPRYWRQSDGQWFEFTLAGLIPWRSEAPLQHISFYEADAYARWRGLRLPTEAEWEWAATHLPITTGNTLESGRYQAGPATGPSGHLLHAVGGVWEWTQSAYAPYPGYRPPGGALGEYNGKFMNGQYVLRGGSSVTPGDHLRLTYRNFFPPDATWQFSGVRLAEDA